MYSMQGGERAPQRVVQHVRHVRSDSTSSTCAAKCATARRVRPDTRVRSDSTCSTCGGSALLVVALELRERVVLEAGDAPVRGRRTFAARLVATRAAIVATRTTGTAGTTRATRAALVATR